LSKKLGFSLVGFMVLAIVLAVFLSWQAPDGSGQGQTALQALSEFDV